MITILRATPRHGYTGVDHLITGAECGAILGQAYRDWRSVSRAVTAEWRHHRHPRVRPTPPIRITARIGTGDLVERDI